MCFLKSRRWLVDQPTILRLDLKFSKESCQPKAQAELVPEVGTNHLGPWRAWVRAGTRGAAERISSVVCHLLGSGLINWARPELIQMFRTQPKEGLEAE